MTSIDRLFRSWLRYYGPQGWWPADDPFEVMVGALLVQRTSWSNAAQAIARLKARRILSSECLAGIAEVELQSIVEPAGFYRVKAHRLTRLAGFVENEGGVGTLGALPSGALRQKLLSVDGIGPETADAILLYAFERPAVVVDAYLRRILVRMHERWQAVTDDQIRREVSTRLDSADVLNEFHALAVAHGKSVCRSEPSCGNCCIRASCVTGLATAATR